MKQTIKLLSVLLFIAIALCTLGGCSDASLSTEPTKKESASFPFSSKESLPSKPAEQSSNELSSELPVDPPFTKEFVTEDDLISAVYCSTYGDLKEHFRIEGQKGKEDMTYEWKYESGGTLVVTLDFPMSFHITLSDYVIKSMKLLPNDSISPVKIGVKIRPGAHVEEVATDIINGLSVSGGLVKDVMYNYDFSQMGYWFYPLLPESDENHPAYAGCGLEGYLPCGWYFVNEFNAENEGEARAAIAELLCAQLSRLSETVSENTLKEHQDYMAKHYPGVPYAKTFTELLTIASLIQADGIGRPEIYPTIAATYFKRLGAKSYENIKGRLCSPAALYFEVYKKTGLHGSVEGLSSGEYDHYDFHFNTFKQPGIPPSPVCSPSPEALAAAVSPQKDCTYYYYAPVPWDQNTTPVSFYFANTAEEFISDCKKTGWQISPEMEQ